MKGCPYSKFNFKEMEEKCEVTKELTHNAILCDFDYENCPHFITESEKAALQCAN